MSEESRVRYTLAAASVVVVIGAGFAVAGFAGGTDSPGRPVSDEQVQQQPDPDAATVDPDDPIVDTAESASPAASPSATAKRSASPKPTAPKKPRSTATASAPRKPAPAPAGGSVVQQVLAHINAARSAEGLARLTLSAKLSKASTLHTQLMTGACGLSHRCSGEADLGDRFTKQGVRWSSAGENIGYGSAGSSNAAIVRAANGLTDSMLAEKPPNDGHRKNLLNKSFTTIGLSIVRDSGGRVWMTQDFTG
jgi:uncharacterized protein YkwD